MSRQRSTALNALADALRQRLASLETRRTNTDEDVVDWLRREAPDLIEALRRVDAGTYGICLDCERDIPLVRLRVRPEAVRCVQCQSIHERQPPRPALHARLAAG